MGRKRQTKISFSPLASSSAAASASSPSRPIKRRKLDTGRVRGVRELSDSDNDSDLPLDRNHGLPTPKKSFQSTGTPPRSEVERGMRLGMPVTQQKNGMFANSSDYENFLEGSSTEASEDEEIEEVKPAKRRSGRKTTIKVEGDEESEEVVITPKRSSGRQKPTKQTTEGEGDDESDEIQTPHRRSGRKKAAQQIIEEDEQTEKASTPKRRLGRRQAPVQVLDDDEDDTDEESEEATSPKERRATQNRNKRRNNEEQNDLEEDLAFLNSSPPSDKERSARRKKPMNARQKALEVLKRQRASTNAEPSSSAASGRRNRVIISSDSDSDSNLEVIVEDVDSNEDVDSDEVQQLSDADDRADTDAVEMFQENADDAEFIDSDEEGLIGAPAELESLPLEFSSLSRAKPRELFKYAVDWMVQKKINPAFYSDDPIYNLTFRKLDDEVTALANSKYSSAAWTADFTRSLRARPDALIEDLGKHSRMILDAHCEACNRKGHPATFNICFTGKPYNRDTLEPLADDEASSSTSDSDSSMSSSEDETNSNDEKPTYDESGEIIPPESRIFTVGSTCKANAQMAHTLRHWRHHLNSWIVDYLVRTGHCTAEKLVERDRWATKKREKYANKVVKEMERGGEISKLHKLYKDQVKFASETKNDFMAGWGK